MTRARQAEAWNHTASVLAMLANVNRDPKKGRALKPADFHPLHAAKRAGPSLPLKDNWHLLKKIFVDNAPRKQAITQNTALAASDRPLHPDES